jgi:enterochelin esterase-like enzyme
MSMQSLWKSFWFLVLALVASTASAAPQVEHIVIPSPALGHEVSAELYLPPGFDADRDYRLVVLLHGQNSTTDRFERIGMFDLADTLTVAGDIVPLVMVAPEIDNSFGVNSAKAAHLLVREQGIVVDYPEGNYEDFLTADLPAFMADTYGAGNEASERVYAGISMGGYAALRLGLAFPDLAKRIAGHSPAVIGRGFSWLYPDDAAWQARSLPILASNYVPSDQLFYIDCGKQDDFGFFPAVQKLALTLQMNKASIDWQSASGGHNDAYWGQHVAAYLRFYGAK